ncbi:cytochrome P450 [Williamsia sp. 1138]|uniref:cytochrome P450 n=1 Tax=Williamsia sp. 1138 TaxID=1903117 RepID=UPI000A102CB1|nr:cytochrome P450 [Williamsia sp. 1138]OZG27821.1 cytochrome P450 [Williamsia sp. 1138]
MPSHHTSVTETAPQLTGLAAIRVATLLGFPAVAAGVIARRRAMMGVLERIKADRAPLDTIRELRRQYGSGPLRLVLPGRTLVVVLDANDVARVLDESPDPFTPANREKVGALSPFQPHGVLISKGPIRNARRRVNEEALDTDRPLHHLASPFVDVITDEVTTALQQARPGGTLSAADFTVMWWRIARRVTLGDAARDDDSITDALWTLRSNGNWTYLHPKRRKVRDRFYDKLYAYVDSAPPNTLISALAATPAGGAVDPVGQIPHWLFAFDAAGIAASRAMALLATHPDQRTMALGEIDASTVAEPQQYSYLRACVLESVRLWPTTPAVLRDSTATTTWSSERGTYEIPAGAAFLILASAFHRDGEAFDFADRFAPEIWLDGRAQQAPALIPFSAGPVVCPGQNLVLHLTSTTLAVLLTLTECELVSSPTLSPAEPLPITLNNFGLEFGLLPRRTGSVPSPES